MDPVINPYQPGAGLPPPVIAGRQKELGLFEVATKRTETQRPARGQLLIGRVGVGKTVLLAEFGRIATRRGWVHVHVEASARVPVASAIDMLIRKALLRLHARSGLGPASRRALGALAAFGDRWGLPRSPDTAVAQEPMAGTADTGYLEADLAALLVEVGEVARTGGTAVAITIDELQSWPESSAGAVMDALHSISPLRLPILPAAASLPTGPKLAPEGRAYAAELFEAVPIGALADEDARDALTRPAIQEGVTWTSGALDKALQLTGRYPYFLQELAKHSWDIAPGPASITQRDVAAATPVAIAELDTGFFAGHIDRATPAELAYVVAMASLGPGEHRSGEIARALGKTTTQLGPVRDSVIKRGLCYPPSYGYLAFTVPLFGEFLRRAGPRP